MTLYNFSAGPAVLPAEVLKIAADEMSDWQGAGMSVMEMSHRGPEFGSILKTAQEDLRELLNIPDDYAVLFLQGGGLGESAIVPLNLLGLKPAGAAIDFIHTGTWSGKSIDEAKRYAPVRVAASSQASKFTTIPERASWQLSDDAAYLHVCTNETIHGVEFHAAPEVANRVLVADMSSHILSRTIDVSRYGVIYAGAQKNIGPAGLVLVIVRRDLLGHALPICPSVFNWAQQAENDSMVNTPPTYAIYIAGLVFQWIKRQGGVAAIEVRNLEKAKRLYDFLDGSDFYRNTVDASCRSRMNVPFFLRDESQNAAFLQGAQARGLLQLKGHKSVGGMRASLYNAMSLEGVDALIDYLRAFARKA